MQKLKIVFELSDRSQQKSSGVHASRFAKKIEFFFYRYTGMYKTISCDVICLYPACSLHFGAKDTHMYTQKLVYTSCLKNFHYRNFISLHD